MSFADKIQAGAGASISGDGSSGNPYIVSSSPSHLYFGADSWYPANANVLNNGGYSTSSMTFTNGGGGAVAYTKIDIIPPGWATVDVYMYWVNADTDEVDWNLQWFIGTPGAGYPFGPTGSTGNTPYIIGVAQRLNKTLLTAGLAVTPNDMIRFNLARSGTDPSTGNQIVLALDVVKAS
jgi:hypothetical protein